MVKENIIQEILDRKVTEKNPDISDIVERHNLSDAELTAVRKYEARIDSYMDVCHDCIPDAEGTGYVASGRAARKAIRIVTTIPFVIAGGVSLLLRRHLVKTAVVAVATAATSRAVERRYGLMTKRLESKGGLINYLAIQDVNLAARNLKRVLEYEEQQRQ